MVTASRWRSVTQTHSWLQSPRAEPPHWAVKNCSLPSVVSIFIPRRLQIQPSFPSFDVFHPHQHRRFWFLHSHVPPNMATKSTLLKYYFPPAQPAQCEAQAPAAFLGWASPGYPRPLCQSPSLQHPVPHRPPHRPPPPSLLADASPEVPPLLLSGLCTVTLPVSPTAQIYG